MSAERQVVLTVEQLRGMLEEAAEKGAERAIERLVTARPKKTKPAPVVKPEISETDRAAARAYARKLGMFVRDKK